MPQLDLAQIDHYQQNGYVVVGDLLSPAEADAFVAYEADLKHTDPRSLKNHRDDEQWAQLAHHPNITGVVRQLLTGSPRIVQTMYRIKRPGAAPVSLCIRILTICATSPIH